jgi:hypothetical protein
MPSLRLFTPPYQRDAYQRDDRVRDETPPLGTIVLSSADSAQRIASELEPFLSRAPWCIPCLAITDATAAPDVLAAIHGLPGQPVFIREPPNPELLPTLALAAVRRRTPPAGRLLADYVARRIGWPALRSTLESLLSAAAEEPATSEVPVRTLRDRLRRLGPLTPRCWRTIGTLSRIAATASGSGVDTLAWRAGVCPRSLRTWSRRYLGLSLREFRVNAGWEWVVEAALRKAGYVEAPAAVAPRLELVAARIAPAASGSVAPDRAVSAAAPALRPPGRAVLRALPSGLRRRGREPAGAAGNT